MPSPDAEAAARWYLVGLDQILVDMEVHADAEFAADLGVIPGESVVLSSDRHEALLARIARAQLPCRYAPGGSVGNTLNNYTHLSGEPAVLLGQVQKTMEAGSPAFHYVAQTPGAIDLRYLVPMEGATGTAITFVAPSGERSFAVAPGISTQFGADDVPEELVANAAALVVSLYTLRDPDWPIAVATRRAMAVARDAGVPVAFGMGTASLVEPNRDMLKELLAEYVTIAAMNEREAEALTGQDDALLACRDIMQWVDLVLVTEGARGLTLGGWVDDASKRATRYPVHSGALPDYNEWEFSRMMRKEDCVEPVAAFSHIHPYKGGPDRLVNTNGAGDAALAAILHDVAANRYHQESVPKSSKHAGGPFLTYSSLSRSAQYGNRVAYEVLRGSSPRLDGPVGSDAPDPEAPHR